MMFEHSHHNTRHNKIILLLGAVIALGFWLAEGILHLFIFDRQGIVDMLFPSNSHELWMRSLVTCSIIGFSIYVQLIVNKLHENKERYRALFESAPDAIFLADAESGEILDANPTASQLLRRPREEIVGLHQSQLHPPATKDDSTRIFTEHIEKVTKENDAPLVEHTIIRSDGTEVPVEIAAQIVPIKGKPVLQGIFRDITERKKVAEALTESEEKYRHLFSSETDAIIVFDAQTFQMIDVNDAGLELYGYSKEEFLKLRVQDISAEVEKTIETVKRLRNDRQGNIPLRYHRKKDGTVFPVEISPGTFTLKNRKVLCGIIRDITERKKAEEALQRQSDLLESIRSAQSLFITGDDPKPVFESLLETLVEITDSEYGFLDEVLRDENGRLFKKSLALTNISWDEESHKLYKQLEASDLEFRNLNNLAGTPAKTGELVISNEPTGDSRSGGIPEGHPPIRAFMGIPMFFGGELVGVAGVANRNGGYDEEIASFLDTFISTCASIIQAIRDDRQRQQIAKKLAESEEKYRRVVEDQTEFVVRWLPDGTRTFVNDSYCRYYGISHDEAIGTSFFPLITEDYREEIRKKIESVTPENPVRTGENKTIRPDGTIGWNQWTDRAIFDKEGKLIEFQSVGRDVTERKIAEENLQRESRLRNTLLDNLPCVAMILRKGTREIIACNEVARKAGAVVGKTCFETCAGRDENCTFCLAPEVWDTNEPRRLEVEFRGTDYEGIWVPLTEDLYVHYVFDISELKKVTKAVRMSEEKYRTLFEGANDAIFVLEVIDNNLRFKECNSRTEKMFGCRKEDIIGKSPVDFSPTVQPDGALSVEKATQLCDAALTGEPQQFEWKHCRTDSTEFYTEVTLNRIDISDKSCLQAIVRDITERKQLEADMHLQSEIAKNIAEGIYLVSTKDLKIVYANSTMERMFGYAPGEMTGRPVSIINAPAGGNPEQTAQEIEAALKEKGQYRGDVLTVKKDGTPFWSRTTISTMYHPEYGDVYVSLQADITERKEMEAALRESEEKFKAFFHQAGDYAFVLDPNADVDLMIIDANESACRAHGYSRDELIGKSALDLDLRTFSEEERARMDQKLQAGETLHFETTHRRKDGSPFPIEVAAKAVQRAGKPPLIFSTERDITERKQAELQLRQNAEQLAILLKTNIALTKSLDLTDILQILTDSATEILDGGTAAVYLLNEDTLYLGAATPSLSPEFPDNLRRAILAEHPHIQKVINSGSVLVIPDAKTADLTEAERKVCDMRSLRTIVFFPLIGSKGVMGVYIVSSTDAPRKFAESQINLCHALGSQASIAIENARLYQSVQDELKERQKAEAALQESEIRYRSVVENAGEGIVVTQDGILKFTNPHLIDVIGYSEMECLSRPFIELVHPDDQEAVMEIHNKRLKGEEVPPVYEFRAIHNQGHTIWLENNGILIEWEGKPASLNFLRDITDRKKVEETVRNIAEGVSAATGEVFFRLLVQYLAKTLDADYALVGELNGEQEKKIKTLAVCAHGEIIDNIEYELVNTPCENVVGKHICSYPNDVQAQFPLDKMLQEMGVESYVGAPLFDSSGHPLGIAVVLDSKPLSNPKQAESMLQIFAVRASAELEREKAETALAESERKFRKFFENEPEYCYMVSPQGTILEANHAALNTLGYTTEELAGKPLMTIYAPESHQRMHQLITQWEQTGEIRNEEMVILTKNGGRRTVLLSATQMSDENGKPLHSISIQRDITERKKAAEALKEERDKLQALMDGINRAGIGIDIVGADHQVLFQNQTLEDRFDKLTGKPCYEHFMAQQEPCDLCTVTEAIRQNASLEIEQKGHDGRDYQIFTAPVPEADGFVNKAVEIVLDITERKQAEIELERQRYYLAKAQEMGKLGTWELDIEKNKLVWTDENYRIFGLDIGTELTYEVFLNCVHPDDRDYIDQKWKAALNGEPYDVEHRILVSGEVKWVREKADMTFGKNGNPVLAIGFTQDITARKQSEDALRYIAELLRESQKVADLGHYVFDVTTGQWESSEIVDTILGIDENYPKTIEGWIQIVCPEQRDEMSTYLSDFVLGQGQNFDREYRITRISDQQIRWVHGLGRLEFNDEGKPIQMIGTIQDITERKRAELALQESEERYRSFVQNFQGIAYRGTMDFMPVFFHGAVEEITGYTEEEFLKGEPTWDKLIHPDDLHVLLTEDEKKLHSVPNHAYEREYRIVRKDGQIRWIQEIIQNVCDDSGNPAMVQGAIHDITERKMAERALRDSERFLQNIFDGIRDGISILDRDLNVVRVNKWMEEMYGNEVSLLGNKCYRVYHRRESQCPWCPSIRTIETGEVNTKIVPYPFGANSTNRIELSAFPLKGADGSVIGVIEHVKDVTERLRAEEALRINEKRYRAIVEDQTELICRCLPDGTLTFVNETYCRYFAKSRDELIGKKFIPFIPEEDHQKVKRHFSSVGPDNPVATHEHQVIMPNGDICWHQWTNRAIFDDAGNIVEFQGVGRDFTKQKMAEEELRQSEKRLRSLSEAAFEGIAFTENGVLIDANEAFAKIYDCRLEELKGSHVIELVAPEHRKIAMINMRPGHEGTYEHKGLRKDGSLIDLEIHGRDVEYQGRRMRLTAIRDITQHKLAERKIKDYQVQLKSLASELSLAEERERRRIAIGIHDDIAQKLAMAKFSLQSLQASVKDTNVSVSLEKQCELMSQVVADARSLTFELGNPVLYQVGLEAAVESYLTERIQDEFGIECKFKSEGPKSSLDEDIRVVLFQAVRELLANVIKHANASTIEVCVRNTEDSIQIVVEDNGVGFDPNKIGPHTLRRGGFGLFNIRERLEYFGGSLDLESRPKCGTSATMTVAIKADAVTEQKEMLP